MVDYKEVIGTIAYMGGVMSIPEAFMFSLIQMIQYNNEFICQPNQQIWYTKAISSYHSTARNDIADHFKGDWVLFLDTDHSFDPDFLARMLNLIKRCDFPIDVLTGLYQYKHSPYLPAIYTHNKKHKQFSIIAKWQDAEIFPIDSAGAGCLFVRRSVFDRIRLELHEEPFNIIQSSSEDVSFFRRCQKLGIKAYCAPHIESHHLSVKPITIEDLDLSMFDLSRHIPVKI